MRIMSFKSLAATAAVGALAVGFTLMAPASAQAASATRSAITSPIVDDVAPVEMQRRGGFRGGPRFVGRPGFRPGRGRGWGGAAVGLGAAGLIIGGAAAAAAASGPGYYRECWVERRWVETPWGPEPRRVRVCN
jgi:hypothetical protein